MTARSHNAQPKAHAPKPRKPQACARALRAMAATTAQSRANGPAGVWALTVGTSAGLSMRSGRTADAQVWGVGCVGEGARRACVCERRRRLQNSCCFNEFFSRVVHVGLDEGSCVRRLVAWLTV
eukprot:352226-Chlamydomonas_euryale.AAC.5